MAMCRNCCAVPAMPGFRFSNRRKKLNGERNTAPIHCRRGPDRGGQDQSRAPFGANPGRPTRPRTGRSKSFSRALLQESTGGGVPDSIVLPVSAGAAVGRRSAGGFVRRRARGGPLVGKGQVV